MVTLEELVTSKGHERGIRGAANDLGLILGPGCTDVLTLPKSIKLYTYMCMFLYLFYISVKVYFKNHSSHV